MPELGTSGNSWKVKLIFSLLSATATVLDKTENNLLFTRGAFKIISSQ